MRRSLRLAARLLRWFVYAVFFTLVLVVVALVVLQTGWAKNQIRALIVRQANQYLTATLSIGRLQGSLVRGVELSDVKLARNGRTLISIDDVAVAYSIRELFDQGTSIRQIRIARPHVVVEKEADGRWNLGALIKRIPHESLRRNLQRRRHGSRITKRLRGHPILTIPAMQVAPEHAETVGERAWIGMKEGLLLNGIALHASRVSPGDIKFAIAIEAHFAYARLSVRDGAAVATGEAANAVVAEILDQR